jgi:predicted phosphohydrolase
MTLNPSIQIPMATQSSNRNMKTMVVISDTHGLHAAMRHSIPPGDILVHCGDCTKDIGQSDLRYFLQWFNAHPHAVKILIAGNHDGAFEKWPDLARAMVKEVAPTVTYLQDSGCEFFGIKFWGSPVQPEFCNWFFNRQRGPDIKRHWDLIPDGTDVLITHGPPSDILDVSGFDNAHCGCSDLMAAVNRVKPKYHLFGHIHHSYGFDIRCLEPKAEQALVPCCTFINASICDERHQPTRAPQVIGVETP